MDKVNKYLITMPPKKLAEKITNLNRELELSNLISVMWPDAYPIDNLPCVITYLDKTSIKLTNANGDDKNLSRDLSVLLRGKIK